MTIDIYWLIPIAVGLLGVGIGIHERGIRRGHEMAEELYEPLIDMLKAKLEEK